MLPCCNGARALKPPFSRDAHSAKTRHCPCVSFRVPRISCLHRGGSATWSGADGARRNWDGVIHGYDPNSMGTRILPRRRTQCSALCRRRFRLRSIHRYPAASHGSTSPSVLLLPSSPCFGASSCLRLETGKTERGRRRFRHPFDSGNSTILPSTPRHFLRASLCRRARHDMLRLSAALHLLRHAPERRVARGNRHSVHARSGRNRTFLDPRAEARTLKHNLSNRISGHDRRGYDHALFLRNEPFPCFGHAHYCRLHRFRSVHLGGLFPHSPHAIEKHASHQCRNTSFCKSLCGTRLRHSPRAFHDAGITGAARVPRDHLRWIPRSHRHRFAYQQRRIASPS